MLFGMKEPREQNKQDIYFDFFPLKPGRPPAHQIVFLLLVPLDLPSGLVCMGEMKKPSLVITNLLSLVVVGSMPCEVEYGKSVSLFPRSL